MDDDDIYDCPPQDKDVGASFKAILSAFQNTQRNSIPIKVAKDGRYQAKDEDENKPITGPKPSLTKPWLANRPTGVPLKSFNKKPPEIPLKTTPKADINKPQNPVQQQPSIRKSSSGRSSIFPPQDQSGDNTKQDVKKKPLQPINGIHPILPPQVSSKSRPDSSPVLETASGNFRKKSLPPLGSGPPEKPQSLPENIIMSDTLLFDEEDDLEIYDDIEQPNGFPPPPPATARPTSMIPEMTEDEEIDKRKSMKNPKVIESDDDQELYDDVEHGTPAADYDDDSEGGEEIYEAVDEL